MSLLRSNYFLQEATVLPANLWHSCFSKKTCLLLPRFLVLNFDWTIFVFSRFFGNTRAELIQCNNDRTSSIHIVCFIKNSCFYLITKSQSQYLFPTNNWALKHFMEKGIFRKKEPWLYCLGEQYYSSCREKYRCKHLSHGYCGSSRVQAWKCACLFEH